MPDESGCVVDLTHWLWLRDRLLEGTSSFQQWQLCALVYSL